MPQRAGRGLTALLLVLALSGPARAEAVLSGTLRLPARDETGGLSGLELSADGTRFTAISDRGGFVAGTIRRNGGAPAGLGPLQLWPMHDPDGRPIAGLAADAEGLAQGPDGRLYVSFERDPRIWVWSAPGGRPAPVATPPKGTIRYENGGMEALAIAPDGTLVTLPEGGTGPHRLLRVRAGRWLPPLPLPRRGEFRPVGADFGPDGRFYLLERARRPLGFQTRIRRFDLGPDAATGETVLLTTPSLRHGNLEGLSVWRDATGAIRLTMVTDDNQIALQRNEIVEYRLVSAPKGR